MKRLLLVVGALSLFSVTGAALGQARGLEATIVNTPANPVPVRTLPLTHMGAKVQDHVTLSTGSGTSTTAACGNDTSAFRVSLDGSSSSFFTVPAGKALVITDIGFGVRAQQGYPWSVGTLVSADLRASGGSFSRAWQSTVVVDAAMAAGQALWRNEQILSGVVIGPGQSVCLRAALGFEASGTAPASFINLTKLHGYLVDL